jgi:cephalosporin hydroxylase
MRKVHSTRGRDFAVAIPQPTLLGIQAGTLRTRYKGMQFCKNPFDIANYLRLLEVLRPRTIIEIGTAEGGSAVWFRDQCRTLGLETGIYSYDLNPPMELSEESIVFGRVDAYQIEQSLPASTFAALPHPWLVIEDSAHTYEATLRVLRYFDRLLVRGDYVVVEDGVVADLPDADYGKYDDGPNRAVAEFLESAPLRYEIDTETCDFFGHNTTYCPNAWLRVVGE